MKAKVYPSKPNGTVSAPASKSMAHRLLICAGLSKGESLVSNISYSEDILATLDCLEAMGAKVERRKDSVKINGASPCDAEGKVFFARESGSTLRFFIPLLLLSENMQSFTGCGRLMQRPMSVYEEICKERRLFYSHENEVIKIKGRLNAGEFRVKGDISSQFISGLLFALPFLNGDSVIKLIPPVESRSYINMTINAMAIFGVEILWQDENTLYIKGQQSYKACDVTTEGDWSNAAFLDALNLIGGECEVTGLLDNSLQGDKVYREYFSLLKSGTPELDVTDCPDLAPILMTMAAYLNGATLTGTKRLKIKESDRGVVMKQELSKFGADIEIFENSIVIKKAQLHTPTEVLCSHNDHRIVMSLCVLSLAFSGVIENAQAVDKSFPDFFEKIRELSGKVELYDDK